MRKMDDGKLTTADKKTLTQQQNQLSKQIYQDKHNAAVQNTNPKSEVGKREENQQDRIAQGIKSGQLTAGEAAHLENNETRDQQRSTKRSRRQRWHTDAEREEASQPAAKPAVAPDLSRQTQRTPPVIDFHQRQKAPQKNSPLSPRPNRGHFFASASIRPQNYFFATPLHPRQIQILTNITYCNITISI